MALYRSRGYLELNPSFTLTPAKTPFLFIFRFVPSIRTRCLLNYSSISLKGKPTIRNCCVTPPQMYVYPDPIPQFAQDVRITLSFFPLWLISQSMFCMCGCSLIMIMFQCVFGFVQETQKFRTELMKELLKEEEIFGCDLVTVVEVCAEVFFFLN